MNLNHLFRRNPDTLVTTRVRRLAKAMDAGNALLRDAAERDLRDTILMHYRQISPKPLRTALAKLVDASVQHERMTDLDALTQLDRSVVTEELIFDIQHLAGRLGELTSVPANDPGFLLERAGAPPMFDEEFPADDFHSAELTHVRHQLHAAIEKLEALVGRDAVALVRLRSKRTKGADSIDRELTRYESEHHPHILNERTN